ncbi:MAG TPA: hypothetical protein VIM30_03105 [Candidatus Limnocylindrales bacterium]
METATVVLSAAEPRRLRRSATAARRYDPAARSGRRLGASRIAKHREAKMPEQGGTQVAAPQAPADRHRAAMATAREDPVDYVPRHVTAPEIRLQVHGTGTMGRFNSRLALLITRAVGTMWAAYLFVVISLVSFPEALTRFLHGDTVTGITWLSQSFLQLVLLPIIIVGQNIISTAQDARAEADHETLTALHSINVRELQILEQQERILEALGPKGA